MTPALPEAPRDFGFFVDGTWRAGDRMFTRTPAGHGGPVTRTPLCSTVDLNTGFIAKGPAEGPRVVCGGTALDMGHGPCIAPTRFSGVTPDVSIARDEAFGPVRSSFTFDTAEQAITLAGDTVYGLAASVWSKTVDIALPVTRRVTVGQVPGQDDHGGGAGNAAWRVQAVGLGARGGHVRGRGIQ